MGSGSVQMRGSNDFFGLRGRDVQVKEEKGIPDYVASTEEERKSIRKRPFGFEEEQWGPNPSLVASLLIHSWGLD